MKFIFLLLFFCGCKEIDRWVHKESKEKVVSYEVADLIIEKSIKNKTGRYELKTIASRGVFLLDTMEGRVWQMFLSATGKDIFWFYENYVANNPDSQKEVKSSNPFDPLGLFEKK